MELTINKEEKKEFFYLELYQYYRALIQDKKLMPGTRMPSLRVCAKEFHLSRTTVETAYLQLAADGYIISRPQSGYYVTDIAFKQKAPVAESRQKKEAYLYHLSSSGVDRESFRFDLWRRYIKSALRQDERLLSYGEPQGESDFREALADYIRVHRNIICSPEDIVVGAGVQSLLQILCPLLKESLLEQGFLPDREKNASSVSQKQTTAEAPFAGPSVSFPNPTFTQGIRIFDDFGFEIHHRDKDSKVIYVTPAHMTKWGEIMPVSRRIELIRYASEHHSLVIEDDLENEFVYLQKPTPSLFSLAGGQDIVYIGSFSRLLLPSIRISFMILPPVLKNAYQKKAAAYNQTASKAEQIALCQFIRDGHLAAQTRRLKRLYSGKLRLLQETVQTVFGENCQIRMGSAGTSLALTLPFSEGKEAFLRRAAQKQIRVQVLENDARSVTVILSASSLKTEEFAPACRLLASVLEI